MLGLKCVIKNCCMDSTEYMAAFSICDWFASFDNAAFCLVIVVALSAANLVLIVDPTLLYIAMNNESGSKNLDTVSNLSIANMNLIVSFVLPLKRLQNFVALALVSCIWANTFVNNKFVLYKYTVFYCFEVVWGPYASNMHIVYHIYTYCLQIRHLPSDETLWYHLDIIIKWECTLRWSSSRTDMFSVNY